MADLKRTLDIEAALTWAFREELPKTAVRHEALAAPDFLAKPGEGWGAIENYAELLTRVDSNRYGVVPDLWNLCDPHPDAVMIGEAVKALDLCDLEIPPDWYPLDDMGDLGAAGRACVAGTIAAETVTTSTGLRRLRIAPSVLVTKYALLGRGRCPEWECDVPEVKYRTAPGRSVWFRLVSEWRDDRLSGKPYKVDVEVDGFNERSRRPYADAYRKPVLSPDPTLGILGRAEYEVWHAALGALFEDLAPRLDSIALRPFDRAARPWMAPERQGSILPWLEALASPLSAFAAKSHKNRSGRLTCDRSLT